MKKEEALIGTLNGDPVCRTPLWVMRQAGRYLPEYRKLRDQAGSFWALCREPELSAEATLQPIRRFGFDAAIIFSDILMVPDALGVPVEFTTNGPKLQLLGSSDRLELDPIKRQKVLEPVYAAIELVRGTLGSEALLGFAGAPWTLASYMAAGGGGDGGKAALIWAYRNQSDFDRLISILSDCVAEHLVGQLRAGADAVQLFDSAVSGLSEGVFLRFVLEPTKKIVGKIRASLPNAKIIGFPRGATLEGYRMYAAETGVDGVSLDTAVPLEWAKDNLNCKALQGNLDPVALLAGGKVLEAEVAHISNVMRGRSHIFNLGHGILPETPVEHVEKLVSLIRG
jgi:uroporphyrinogen decarboxylase